MSETDRICYGMETFIKPALQLTHDPESCRVLVSRLSPS